MTVTVRTNLLTNPSFETNTTGWTGTNCTLASSTAQAAYGTHCLALTATAIGAFSVATATGTSGFSVTGATSYALQGQIRAAATAQTVTATITWYDSTGATISSNTGTGVADSTTGFATVSVVAASPSNAAYGSVKFSWANAAASEVHYLDACLVEVASSVGTYFDGSFVSAAGVVYAWSGSANASTSTATTYQPVLSLSQGSTPSPNVVVTMQDLDPNTDVINIWRTVDGIRRPVRGARRRSVVGSDFVTDYEAPLGRTISYDMEILTGICAGVTVTTATTTISNPPSGWLSDPLVPSSAVAVYADIGPNGEPGLDFDALAGWDYAATVSKMAVMGTNEPVLLVGQRQAGSGIDVNMTTLATAQSSALRSLVKQAGTLLFRPLPGWASGLPALCYLAAAAIKEMPQNEKFGGQMVAWKAKGDIGTPPAANIVAPTTTYGTVSGNYSTYGAFVAAHPGQTYLDVIKAP